MTGGARTHRLVVYAGFAAAAVVAASLAALWPEAARAWHLRVLQGDPSLLEPMLLSASATKRAAARDFVAEPAGQERLFRLYLEEYDRTTPSWNNREQLLRHAKDPTSHGIITLWQDGMSWLTWSGSPGHSQFSLANSPDDPARRARVLELLPACAGRTFRVAGLPGLEFAVQPIADGMRVPAPPSWSVGGDPSHPGFAKSTPLPGPATHACYYRVIGP